MTDDLGTRLQALAPPIELPVDLIDGVRRRARRRLAARITGASAGVAAAVVGVLVAVHVLVGPAGPSDAQLRALVAAGSAGPVPYTGPGIPQDLAHTTLWLIGEHYSSPQHTVVVSYRKDGHPCIGEIEWSPLDKDPQHIGSSADGTCSIGDTIEALGSYGPLGPANMVGSLALLYGTVPGDVRIVRADVRSGPRLGERFVATVATPATTKERFFLFTAPNGTEHGIDVDLTFYDVNGDRVGSRHVRDQFDVNGDGGCPSPEPGSACTEVSATPPS